MFLRFMHRSSPFLVVGNILLALIDLLTGDFVGAVVSALLAWACYEGGKWIALNVEVDRLITKTRNGE